MPEEYKFEAVKRVIIRDESDGKDEVIVQEIKVTNEDEVQ